MHKSVLSRDTKYELTNDVSWLKIYSFEGLVYRTNEVVKLLYLFSLKKIITSIQQKHNYNHCWRNKMRIRRNTIQSPILFEPKVSDCFQNQVNQRLLSFRTSI